MKFERARSDEHKEIRLKEIKDSALKLFYDKSYSEISMAGIAKELNFTRGNLYKYYQTKEAIYLDIILDDISKWSKDLQAAFSKRKPNSTEEFVELWTDVTLENDQLIQLLSILFTILEKNTSVETLVNFKKKMMVDSFELSKVIQAKLNINNKDTLKFLNYHIATATGLYPMCYPSATQVEAVKHCGMQYEFSDFRTTFSEYLLIYIKHLLNNPSE